MKDLPSKLAKTGDKDSYIEGASFYGKRGEFIRRTGCVDGIEDVRRIADEISTKRNGEKITYIVKEIVFRNAGSSERI